MANKPLTCPQCGGQNLTISEQYQYSRYFRIEDNKLFGLTDAKYEDKLETWIDCDDCRQDDEIDNDIEVCEWIANDEEKSIIWRMLDAANQPTDVSEFMSPDYKIKNEMRHTPKANEDK